MRHALCKKNRCGEKVPLAADAFESSSGIPFLSLPNMGVIVRAEWNPLVMSELWNRESHSDWKFTGRNVGNARITETVFPHVCL